MIEEHDGFRDWAPIRFFWNDGEPFVEWCYMADVRFTHPFFEDTIQGRMRLPFNAVFRKWTPISYLAELVDDDNAIPPTGFIFHMSRCGSTLVSQMLAALDTNIVMSEPPVIDAVVTQWQAMNPDKSNNPWLKWMIGVLGRKRVPGERRYFIKFDSWSTLDLDMIVSEFPTVPMIFLYRNPVEVIVSQLNEPGMHMVQGALEKRVAGLSLAESLTMSREEYCARVLAAICTPALKFADDDRMLFVNYEQLPDAVFDEIAEHFRVAFEPGERDLMKATTTYHAKNPLMTFEPDTETKRTNANEDVRAAAARVDPLFERMEQAREKR